jgi:hypothetical protein
MPEDGNQVDIVIKSFCMLGRIERLDGVVSQHPIWQRVSSKVGFKAIKKRMHSWSKPKSGRLGQTAESHGQNGGRAAISYKFPADDGFSFAVWELWVGSGMPFMLKYARGIPN